MLNNIEIDGNKTSKEYDDLFINSNYETLSLSCNILNGNFFSDSFYYFPITKNYETFSSLYLREFSNLSHFYTKKFFDNLIEKEKSLKSFNNVYMLGSNSGNNYYSNLLQFLPRIFFNNQKKIKIAIHRNSSNKYREFLKAILKSLNIEYNFIFLDDDFYYFRDSQFPQFMNINSSIKVLKNFFNPKPKSENSKKIYVTREDSSYRKIINEGDIITLLRENGFRVINPQLYEIEEQIEIFADAEKIVAPHGSNLANIIFCKPETKIFEIAPAFTVDENLFNERYSNLSIINRLQHHKIIADTIDVKEHSSLAKKYIHPNVLKNSNYYKNLIIKIQDIKDII